MHSLQSNGSLSDLTLLSTQSPDRNKTVQKHGKKLEGLIRDMETLAKYLQRKSVKINKRQLKGYHRGNETQIKRKSAQKLKDFIKEKSRVSSKNNRKQNLSAVSTGSVETKLSRTKTKPIKNDRKDVADKDEIENSGAAWDPKNWERIQCWEITS